MRLLMNPKFKCHRSDKIGGHHCVKPGHHGKTGGHHLGKLWKHHGGLKMKLRKILHDHFVSRLANRGPPCGKLVMCLESCGGNPHQPQHQHGPALGPHGLRSNHGPHVHHGHDYSNHGHHHGPHHPSHSPHHHPHHPGHGPHHGPHHGLRHPHHLHHGPHQLGHGSHEGPHHPGPQGNLHQWRHHSLPPSSVAPVTEPPCPIGSCKISEGMDRHGKHGVPRGLRPHGKHGHGHQGKRQGHGHHGKHCGHGQVGRHGCENHGKCGHHGHHDHRGRSCCRSSSRSKSPSPRPTEPSCRPCKCHSFTGNNISRAVTDRATDCCTPECPASHCDAVHCDSLECGPERERSPSPPPECDQPSDAPQDKDIESAAETNNPKGPSRE